MLAKYLEIKVKSIDIKINKILLSNYGYAILILKSAKQLCDQCRLELHFETRPVQPSSL